MKNRRVWRPYLDRERIRAQAQQWGVPEWAAEFLLRRDVTLNEIQPAETLMDPARLPDMDRAVHTLQRHLRAGHRVRIYGDYDADGVTAVAIMVRGLVSLGYGEGVDYYIPDRFEEGYGMNPAAVTEAHAQGVELLVTVDCGSSSPDAASTAEQLGVDLVITDHHALPSTLPRAAALVNPERIPGLDKLSGAGVALQLMRALAQDAVPPALYGIAALGTVADVVPLLGANRQLVLRGLEAIRQGHVAGIAALLEAANRPMSRAQASDLAYAVGPRINAAGRLGKAERAVELLLADDIAVARQAAVALSEVNRERQGIEREMLEQAWQALAQPDAGRCWAFPVVAGDGWHEGVVGIVAARLREALNRPCAVVAWSGESGKGSARGVDGLDLIGHLRQHQELFTRLGGHSGAAGFSLLRQDSRELSRHLSADLPDAVLMGQYWTQPFDLVVDDEDPIAIWRQLGQFEPFGRQFDAPRFLVRGRLATVRRLGPEGQHVALTLVDHPVRAIAFGMGMGARNWLPGDPVRFIARLETNWYRDQAEPQWRIEWVQGPFPHRMMRPRPGVPDNISGRTLWVVDSDRQLRKEAQARQALAFWHALPLGDLRWIVETARRRHTVEVVVSQWRPWPELLDWADQVIWLCEPRNQRKWAEAGALVKPEGQAYIQIGSGDAAAKSRRLYLDRERLGSVWRRWQAGRPGLVPGGAVLAELELLGQSGATERRSLTNSYLYQRALDEQEQDRNPWTADFELGEDDRHGLEGLG